MQKYTVELAQFTSGIEVNDLFEVARDIQIDQPDKGYRFSIDPFLLVSDLKPQKSEHILDIGTGCGIMPLLLATKYPDIKITAVEIQDELAKIARRNIETNGFRSRINLINCDIKAIQIKDIEPLCTNGSSYSCGGFDRVISNPPYKKRGSGRLNPDIQKATARHEITLTLDELIFCSACFLKPDGYLNLVYPAARLTELLSNMKKHSIEPVNVKFVETVYVKSDKPDKENGKSKLVLITGRNI